MKKQYQEGITFLVLILIILIIIIVGGIGYFYLQKNINESKTENQQNLQKGGGQNEFECKLEPKQNHVIVSGKVEFPSSIKNPTGHKIIVAPDEYGISSSGEFCAHVPSGVFVIGVSSDNDKDFPLLSVIISEKNTNTIINSKSTATGLLFTMPFFITNDPDKATEIIRKIEENPEVATLARVIEEKNFLSSDDIKNGPVAEAIKTAMNSLLQPSGQKNVSDNQNFIINFEMTIKPVNYYKKQNGEYYINGKLIELDRNSQIEFKKHITTKYFEVGVSQIGINITNDTKFSGKQLIDGYNNGEAKIKGYISNPDDLDEALFIANEVFIY